jgi:hypothetical protein
MVPSSRTRWLLRAGLAALVLPPLAAGSLPGPAAAAGPVSAGFTRTAAWETGYSGEFTLRNASAATVPGWTLEFDLGAGTVLTSLWNGSATVSGTHVTVVPPSWGREIPAGGSVSVGFVTRGTAVPAGCRLDGGPCSGGGAGTSGTTTGSSTTSTTSGTTSTTSRTTSTTSRTTSTTTTRTTGPTGGAGTGTFSPYVDTSLFPPFDLVAASSATGTKEFTLAFVVSGGGCTPKWGGVSALGADPVAAQLPKLRAAGGDVRVSFGGAAGTELAQACGTAADLAAAYRAVVDAHAVTKLDFDVEGAAIADAAANARRAAAVATLQRDVPGLDVSLTLPVLPSGLTAEGVALVRGMAQAGVRIGAVNVMAMDYGSGAAPDPSRMGQYAIDAATATAQQIAPVLGVGQDEAFRRVAVTPMIGVNDVASEIFTLAHAGQLVDFARTRHLAWLSMWSGARDQSCPGGPKAFADATCSSIDQPKFAFLTAFAAYRG